MCSLLPSTRGKFNLGNKGAAINPNLLGTSPSCHPGLPAPVPSGFFSLSPTSLKAVAWYLHMLETGDNHGFPIAQNFSLLFAVTRFYIFFSFERPSLLRRASVASVTWETQDAGGFPLRLDWPPREGAARSEPRLGRADPEGSQAYCAVERGGRGAVTGRSPLWLPFSRVHGNRRDLATVRLSNFWATRLGGQVWLEVGGGGRCGLGVGERFLRAGFCGRGALPSFPVTTARCVRGSKQGS